MDTLNGTPPTLEHHAPTHHLIVQAFYRLSLVSNKGEERVGEGLLSILIRCVSAAWHLLVLTQWACWVDSTGRGDQPVNERSNGGQITREQK